jgi:hypothetical protein
MPKIELDMSWAKSVMNGSPAQANENSDKKYDWVNMTGAGTYKFRILPPNSKSPGKFGMVVGKHYGLGSEGKDSCTCVEATYPEIEGLVCPVCEAIRRMKRDGIEEAKKYEAGIYSYIKTIMLETPDAKELKRDKISIFRSKGNYNLNWIINKYMDPDSSDFLSPDNGAAIKFYREQKNGKWDRNVLDTSAVGGGKLNEDPEIQKRLLEENEEITLSDIFRRPTDEEMLKIKELAENLEKNLRAAADTQSEVANDMLNASQSASNSEPEYKTAEEVNNTSTVGTVVPEETKAEVRQDSDEITAKIASMKPHAADNCFGDDLQYNPDSMKCMKCPYSFECASCIKDVRGKDVKMA